MFITSQLRTIGSRIRNMKTWKLILCIVLSVFIILLSFAFLSGPLFPWSPIKIGYDHQDFERATVYFRTGTAFPGDCTGVDDIMDEVEEFHGLEFRDRIKIIFCDSWGLFQRGRLHSLGLKPGGPFACALGTGTVIYFSPRLKGSGRNLRNLLKHELSHAIRYQNTTLLKVLNNLGGGGELHWLDEGVAIYFGNASDYPKAEEFRKLAVEEGYLFRIWDKSDADRIPIEIRHRFRYAQYNFFFGYLIHSFGKDQVLDYVRTVNKDPDRYEDLFQSSFQIPFRTVVSDFEMEIHDGTWPPLKTNEE